MIKFNKVMTAAAVAITLLSSCNDGHDPEDSPQKTGVLIVNEGNFGSGNGSISFYDEELMSITNNVVKNANNNMEIGSTLQSVYQYDGIGYLVCNGTDKIEFISMENYTFLANPETNISQPRYMTSSGDKGYITCWGPWDFSDYSLPDSYVAVMDLNTKTIVDTLQCGSGPEGIIAVGNTLYVANSFETSISVIDLNSKSSYKINLLSAPENFVLDATGTLWVSVNSGLYGINSVSGQKTDSLSVTNIDGKMAIDGEGLKVYLLAVEPWDPNNTNSASEVRVFDTNSRRLDASPLVTGEDFYGIGYNNTTDKLYVADSKAFAGPGQIFIYDINGMKIDEQTVSIGPNGFQFK